jgi:hypothetical protein
VRKWRAEDEVRDQAFEVYGRNLCRLVCILYSFLLPWETWPHQTIFLVCDLAVDLTSMPASSGAQRASTSYYSESALGMTLTVDQQS